MARPKPTRSLGSSSSSPLWPRRIWCWIPPTRPARTGRAFHIASATVSPNPLGKALLHDHVGAALHGVDHGRVLLQVLHRQTRQMHPVTRGARQRRLGSAHLLEDLLALGVVAHRLDRRAGQDQAGAQPVGDVGR
jgi:hypothetical protein